MEDINVLLQERECLAQKYRMLLAKIVEQEFIVIHISTKIKRELQLFHGDADYETRKERTRIFVENNLTGGSPLLFGEHLIKK